MKNAIFSAGLLPCLDYFRSWRKQCCKKNKQTRKWGCEKLFLAKIQFSSCFSKSLCWCLVTSGFPIVIPLIEKKKTFSWPVVAAQLVTLLRGAPSWTICNRRFRESRIGIIPILASLWLIKIEYCNNLANFKISEFTYWSLWKRPMRYI